MSSVFQEIVNLIFTIIVIPAFATLTILFLMYLHSKVVQNIYFNHVLPKIRASGKLFYYVMGYVPVWIHEHSHAELSGEVYDIYVSPEGGHVVGRVFDSIHEMLMALGPSIIPPIVAGIFTLFFYNNFTPSIILWGWNKSAFGPTENAKTFLSLIGVDPNDRLAIPLCTFYMTFEFTMVDVCKTALNFMNINIADPYSLIYIYLIMVLGLGSGSSWYDWHQVFNKFSLGILISCGFAYFALGFFIVLPLHYILLYGMFVCLVGCFLAYLVSSYVLVLHSFSWLQRITSIYGFISTFILANNIIGFNKPFLNMWLSLMSGYCITKIISLSKAGKLKLLKPPKSFKVSPILIFLIVLPLIYYYLSETC